MNKEEAIARYNQLFDTEAKKAAAFEKIAEKYYALNFGSASKTEMDILMFSIYLDQILETERHNHFAYSDYTLSKELGITQSRISNLKVKKQLLYQDNEFNWKAELVNLSERAIYADNKIKLMIPEKTLFLEIKNAIEEAGGFVEFHLTPNLLQVDIKYFFDLMISLDEKNSRKELAKRFREKIEEHIADMRLVEQQPIGKALAKQTIPTIIDLIESCIPVIGGPVGVIARNLYKAITQEGE